MENQIKISDFAKLTKSTMKTILYYHKIGLLKEPKRSPGGYRLYGAEELTRVRLIQRFKSLGMDLKSIKEILGNLQNPKTMREVLQSLRVELLSEMKNLEERLSKIDNLLSKDNVSLNEDSIHSSSFEMISEILGENQMEHYASNCPDLYNQQQKLYGIMDDFQWGQDYTENFQVLAEYFKTHPEQYQIALDFGERLDKLATLSEDDPEIENLARESAEYIKNTPLLKEMLYNQAGFGR